MLRLKVKRPGSLVYVVHLPPLSPTSPFSSLCVPIKHKSLQSDIKNQKIFHYSFILSDLFLSRPVLSRLRAGDVAEMWISLGRLSGTESGYSLLLILMEAVSNDGATIACHDRSQTAAVCSSHTSEKTQVTQKLLLEEGLILQVVWILICKNLK